MPSAPGRPRVRPAERIRFPGGAGRGRPRWQATGPSACAARGVPALPTPPIARSDEASARCARVGHRPDPRERAGIDAVGPGVDEPLPVRRRLRLQRADEGTRARGHRGPTGERDPANGERRCRRGGCGPRRPGPPPSACGARPASGAVRQRHGLPSSGRASGSLARTTGTAPGCGWRSPGLPAKPTILGEARRAPAPGPSLRARRRPIMASVSSRCPAPRGRPVAAVRVAGCARGSRRGKPRRPRSCRQLWCSGSRRPASRSVSSRAVPAAAFATSRARSATVRSSFSGTRPSRRASSRADS